MAIHPASMMKYFYVGLDKKMPAGRSAGRHWIIK
jgi:hypothetical protein